MVKRLNTIFAVGNKLDYNPLALKTHPVCMFSNSLTV